MEEANAGHNALKREIRFIDLLKLSDEEMKHLKLVFNSNWVYSPLNMPDYVLREFGNESRAFNLLSMYRNGEVDLVKKSTTSHNPDGQKRFHNGDIVFTFIPYADKEWLLVNAFKVLDDSKYLVDIDEESMADYAPYFGKLVITWADRKTMNIVMRSKEAIAELKVKKILEKPYNEIEEDFPGYENVDLSWEDLNHVLKSKSWKTALENQKGVYLITDTATNKRYVGSAYGEDMLLGRWSNYAKNGHGGNIELKNLIEEKGFDYIKQNFRYTILEIYKAKVDDENILERESWWKNILLTRNLDFGYNKN